MIESKFSFVLLLTFLCQRTVPFSPPLLSQFIPQPKTLDEKPIKKVAIIGSGIAGLSLAHALTNNINAKGNPIEVSIYESRSSLNYKGGSGIQLNGGMSILHKINPQVHKAVAEASLPLKKVRSRAKPWFESGFLSPPPTAPFSQLLELDIEEAVKATGGDVQDQLILNGNLQCFTMMRGTLQKALMESLPSSTKECVHYGKTLIDMQGTEDNGGGIICSFENGITEGPFDLVVGCDGIRSVVKQYVENGVIAPSSEPQAGGAIYSGIRIQYAVADAHSGDQLIPESEESNELRQYFGDGAYALAGTYGAGKDTPPVRAAFVIFQDDNYFGPFKKPNINTPSKVNENADWSQDKRSEGDARAECLSRIKRSNLPDVEVTPIVEAADRFFELGIYFHNPFSLKGWNREVKNSKGRFCVLSGDAAHAMPPFLGQGANQAVQDAYCLASRIFEFNSRLERCGEEQELVSMQIALKHYEETRWPPTASITVKAGVLGYLETGGKGFLSSFRDSFFKFAGITGVARKVFLDGATPRV